MVDHLQLAYFLKKELQRRAGLVIKIYVEFGHAVLKILVLH